MSYLWTCVPLLAATLLTHALVKMCRGAKQRCGGSPGLIYGVLKGEIKIS
jgi:hypothetical protein